MKRIIFVLSALIISVPLLSQIPHIELLVAKEEKEVRKYLDSLFSLKTNEYYKIETDFSSDGSLILQADFSLMDQEYYTCLNITCIFFRVNGIERCVQQVIMGNTKYGVNNVAYLKDNFTLKDGNRWEMFFNDTAIIKGKFKKEKGENPNYSITYWLEPSK